MAQGRFASIWNGHRPAMVAAGCFLAAAMLGLLTAHHGGVKDFEPLGFATASRTLNQIMAIVMTSIALILPLTSNLYTPRLVKLYVTHPLIVGGLSVFIIGNLLVMALHFFPPGIIGCPGREGSSWRHSRPWFVPGLAKEGQDYLIRERAWPEAYVLAQTLKVAEVATRRQHELLSELAGQLWEARARGLKEAAGAIYWRFLTDGAIHREQLELLLEEKRELHYEFNDRLMRFAHLSPAAVVEAQAFLEQW